MTPKEKAKELVEKHLKYAFKWEVKKATLITADQLRTETCLYFSDRKSYWDQVIREIEKL
jgi:hypothetical protein